MLIICILNLDGLSAMLATLWWFVVTAGQYYWQSLNIITFVNANFFYVPGVWWLLFHNCVNQMELWNYRNKMKTVRLGFFLLALSLFGCCWMTVGGQICALSGISIHQVTIARAFSITLFTLMNFKRCWSKLNDQVPLYQSGQKNYKL